MRTPNFQEKLMLQRGGVHVYQINANDDSGKLAWYLVAVSQEKSKEFLELADNPHSKFTITDYGHILASGYGDEPTEEEKASLTEQYDLKIWS